MAEITVTAASVALSSGTQVVGIAGETITAGQSVYLKASDNRLYKAQADGTAAEADAVGIALHGSLAGQPLAYAGNGSVINIGGTTAAGVFYYVGPTAGGVGLAGDLASTNRVTQLGYATGTSGAVFNVLIKNTGSVLA
jgi:predicted transcriptional regulator